jgi:hypothetical protein
MGPRSHQGATVAATMRSFLRQHPRMVIATAVGVVALLVFVVVWFQPQQALLTTTVNESLPGQRPAPPTAAGGSVSPGGSQVVASGRFRSLEHDTTGRALLVRLSRGEVLLRFETLATLNGPDLHVYLSEVEAGGDAHAYGERFVDLGKLKGNRGNQNYRVPDGIDLSRFKSAVIWCKRFAVGFGVAPLV